MRTFIDNTLTSVREYFSKMSRKRKIALAALSAAVIVLAIVVVAFMSRTVYTTFYSAPNEIEAAEMHNALLAIGAPVRREGNDVLVPEKRLQEIRQTVNAQWNIADTPNQIGRAHV